VALHYYFLSASIGALMTGIFTNGNVVLKKTLDAPDTSIGLMHSIGAGSLLLGIIGSEMVAGRDKRPVILALGLISRGAFLLFFFVKGVPLYIAITAVSVVCNSLLIPATTSLWQSNISQKARNEMWGYSVALATLISMGAAYAMGVLLDHDPEAYRYVFPLAGVLGIVSILVLIRAPLRQRFKINFERRKFDLKRLVVYPARTMVELLKRDKLFFRFESSFFFYGMAFMFMAPLLPHYLVDVAHMSFKQASLCEGVLFQSGSLLAPIWGRMMDRRSPAQLCALVFSLLALFPTLLVLGPYLSGATGIPLTSITYCAYALFGLSMSGLGVAWNLAPVVFAGKNESSTYTGAHVTITGIRGAFAPIIGGFLGERLGTHVPVFVGSICLYLTGAIGMLLLEKSLRERKATQAAEAAAHGPAIES
jgi:MFS family permease